MNEKKVIVFTLGGEKYGVNVEQVLSIEKAMEITRVPNTESYVKGIMNLRGVIYPVVDLQSRFRIGESKITSETRLCIVQMEDVKVALIVDAAEDVITIDGDRVESAPELVGGVEADYINGIAKIDSDLLILLNLDRVLRHDDVEKIKQIEA
ncbi:MAG: chemotaxis protein CheW [Tuberibacillus sp.]